MNPHRSAKGGGGARTLLTACVFVALCFSVGEGVRLIPFPDSRGDAAAPGAAASVVGRPDLDPLLIYRPNQLDLPAKVQKRSKRQTDSCGAATGAAAVCLAPSAGRPGPADGPDHCSQAPAALSPGRAPPRAS